MQTFRQMFQHLQPPVHRSVVVCRQEIQEYVQQKPKLLPSIVSLMQATDYLLPKIKYPECKICSRSPVKMRAFIPLKTGGNSYATA